MQLFVRYGKHSFCFKLKNISEKIIIFRKGFVHMMHLNKEVQDDNKQIALHKKTSGLFFFKLKK